MRRRSFLTSVGAAAACTPALRAMNLPTNSRQAPRKVIAGTVMQDLWGEYPGLNKRLDQLTALVDRMATDSQARYARGLDLAILPEIAVTGELGADALAHAAPLEGAFQDAFARTARQHRCYILAPTYLLESKRSCSNAAVLFDREGRVAGMYRKVHLVVEPDGTMEAGATPGNAYPVFNCDFGKLGIQICYDIEFERGWSELARQGCELVAWPTQSPQTAQPAFRAMQNRFYIVSSTWRHNASVFEPTGRIAAQIRPPDSVLVHELDLSYAILPWSAKLRNGDALRKMYGERVGFRYYEEEDRGIFWSNDPHTPIGEMVRAAGLVEVEDRLAQVRDVYRKVGMRSY